MCADVTLKKRYTYKNKFMRDQNALKYVNAEPWNQKPEKNAKQLHVCLQSLSTFFPNFKSKYVLKMLLGFS